MQARKTTARKPTRTPQVKSTKYRITVIHTLGTFKTMADVNAAKKAIKTKVRNMVFSAPAKTRGGYKFTGKVVYSKSLKASKTAVEAAAKKLAPGAKVTVSVVR